MQTRSFCFIDDMVKGLVSMMENETETGPVNIGNPNEFTIKELAEKVVQFTGSKSELIYNDLPVDDPKQRQPDISKANSILGWQPKIALDDGLKMTIDYFRNLLHMND